jgi:hypothetical protein
LSNQEYAQYRELLFKRTVRGMKHQLLIEIAEEFNLKIPFETDNYEAAQFLIDHLSQAGRTEVINKFGDAGKPVSHFYVLREPSPSIEELAAKANSLLHSNDFLKKGIENQPYFKEAELHRITDSVRIRFEYIKGVQFIFNDKTGNTEEYRRPFLGCLIFRPNSSLLEIRAPHASIAKKVALKTAIMNIAPFVALNLTEGDCLDKLYKWIYTLNNGKIDLPPTDSRSNVSMSARRGRNLLETKDFLVELKRGSLRGGHVTIQKQKDDFMKFFIMVNPCHIHFTQYYSNVEIEYVIDALETIVEGYEFVAYETLLRFLN